VTGPQDPQQPAGSYTFGDNPTAAERLALLAEVFEPATRDLLGRWAPERIEAAVDLGCGPGHSTRLVHAVTGARRTTGVERSAQFLEVARAAAVPGIDYLQHDVTLLPLPVPPARLVHARFLLTHLPEPAGALRGWTAALAPGGRLVAQETARLTSATPALRRYYELVAEVQRAHGQALDIGDRLADLAAATGARLLHAGTCGLRPPVPAMARLHALNLRTWRTDPAAGHLDAGELDALEAELTAIAGGAAAEPIEHDLAELVLVQG
jgi:trans-aconitate 2-methyltransferase